MEEVILKEEFFEFRGKSVPLRIVRLSSGKFETQLLIPGMSIRTPFTQERLAQIYFERLKRRFAK